MVAGRPGMERRSPSAALGATGQPYSGSALPTPNGEGCGKGLPKNCPFHPHHGQATAPAMASLYCGRQRRINVRRTTKKLTVASWIVRTLMDVPGTDRPCRRTALIAKELDIGMELTSLPSQRLDWQILGHLVSLEKHVSDYTVFWSGYSQDDRSIHGVGFIARTSIVGSLRELPVAHGARLMTWRIPLAGVHHTTLVSAYAPTLDSDEATKDAFYNRLDEILRRIPNNDKILLMGDFNARVGSNHLAWEGVLGWNGVGSCNANGHRLLTLCAEHQLTITNTRFQLKEIYKTTRMHPRSKMWHQLDHIMVKQRDFSDVKITRVMRGACGDTDHRLVRSQLTMQLRSRPRGRDTYPRLNTACLKDHSKVDALQSEFQIAYRRELLIAQAQRS